MTRKLNKNNSIHKSEAQEIKGTKELGIAIRRIFGSVSDSDSYKKSVKKTWIFHGLRILGILSDFRF